MILVLLLACPVPVEWARVDPPRPGGVEALAVEDFERDLWLLKQPDHEEALVGRWRDMGLEPTGACAVRQGEEGLVLIVAEDVPTKAMAISLAKTFDNTTPARSLWFCTQEEPELPESPAATIRLEAPSEASTELLEATRLAHSELTEALRPGSRPEPGPRPGR